MDNSEKLPENEAKKTEKDGYMPEKFYKQLNAVKSLHNNSSNNSSKDKNVEGRLSTDEFISGF